MAERFSCPYLLVNEIKKGSAFLEKRFLFKEIDSCKKECKIRLTTCPAFSATFYRLCAGR